MAKEVLNPVQPEMSDFVEDASDPKEDKEAAPAKPAKKKYKTPKNPRSKHLKKLFARVKETGSSADRLTHSIIDEASAAFSFYTPMERIEVLLALESEFCGGKSKKTANLRNRRRAVFRGLIRLECVRHASLSENAFHLFRLLAERKINMTKLVESLDNSSKSKTGPGSKGKSMKEVFLLCFAGKGKKDAELQEALESEELTVQFEEAFALFQEWCNMPVILATPRSPLRHELADRIAACKEKLLNDEQINLQFEDISLLKSPSKSLHFAVLQFYFSYLRNLRDPQESEATAANDPTDDRMSFAMEFLELLNEDSSGYEKGSPPPPPPPPLPQQQRFANLNVGTGMTFNVNTTATSPANAEDFRLCYEGKLPLSKLNIHLKKRFCYDQHCTRRLQRIYPTTLRGRGGLPYRPSRRRKCTLKKM